MARGRARRHVEIKRPALKPLRAVLYAWCEYNERYCGVVNSGVKDRRKLDAPYWYNERASVSTFAAAVVAKKGLALEEYAEKKKLRGRKRKKRRRRFRQGRVDLWFRIGRDEFIAETKQHWFHVTDRKWDGFAEGCSGVLGEAEEDVGDDKYGRETGLAMAFVVPMFYTDEKQGDVESMLRDLRDVAVSREVKADAVAWSFPTLDRMPVFGEWAFPGVFLFLRMVKLAGSSQHQQIARPFCTRSR